MIQKRNRMIMIAAVLAVLVVVIPVSAYEISVNEVSVNAKIVDPAPVLYKQNFSQVWTSNYTFMTKFATSIITINVSGYASSYVNFTATVFGFRGGSVINPNLLQSFWFYNASFAPGVRPSSSELTAGFYVGNTALNDVQDLFPYADRYVPGWQNNTSLERFDSNEGGVVGSTFCYFFSLHNYTKSAQRYNFGINGKAPGEGFCALYDYPRAQNVTMKVTLSLWISGKEISAPIYFYLVDTGATAE